MYLVCKDFLVVMPKSLYISLLHIVIWHECMIFECFFLAVQKDIKMHGNKSGLYAQYLSLAFGWLWLPWATWGHEMYCRMMLSLSLPINLFLNFVLNFWGLWGVRFALVVSLCDLKSRSRVCLVTVVLFGQIHQLVCHLLSCTEMSTALATHSIDLFYVRVRHFVYWVKMGHGPHSSKFLCCSMYCLFCVILCIVCV
jgi:hypothetical protein